MHRMFGSNTHKNKTKQRRKFLATEMRFDRSLKALMWNIKGLHLVQLSSHCGHIRCFPLVSLFLKILKDLCSLQPGPEAGQASVPDLFPALVCDHVPVLLYNHQFGHCSDRVALLQLTEKKKQRLLTKQTSWRHLMHCHHWTLIIYYSKTAENLNKGFKRLLQYNDHLL